MVFIDPQAGGLVLLGAERPGSPECVIHTRVLIQVMGVRGSALVTMHGKNIWFAQFLLIEVKAFM